MTVLHPLTFAQWLSSRLTTIQDRLDRLEGHLPHRQMSEEAKRELGILQKSLLDLILDTRHTDNDLIMALERQFPDYLERSQALSDVGGEADRLEREMEGCPHRCWPTRVAQVERGVEVAGADPVPECLAEGLRRRYPEHIRVHPYPNRPEREAPDLPGLGG